MLSRLAHPATKLLIGLCLLNFAVLSLVDGRLSLGLFGPPPGVGAVLTVGGIRGGLGATVELWRWLSAVYVHLGALHLVMNLLALSSFGRSIEESQGGPRMLVLYVLAGVAGFAASRLWYGPFSPTTAGASGAILGLLGVRVAELYRARHPAARDLLLQNLAYVVAFALLFPVNNAAHLGGFLAGAGGTLLAARVARRGAAERMWQRAAALAVALSIVSQVAAMASPYSAAARELEGELRARGR
jgi:membrane associated rhomboid family serine protease